MKRIIPRLIGSIYTLKCKLLNSKIHIDAGLCLKKRLKIIGDGTVYIGSNCIIGGIPGEPDKYVTIDTHCKNAIIRIGNNVSLYASRISSNYEIVIGDNVLIEDTGILDTDFHSIDKNRGDPIGENYERCKISIGSNVCVGVNSLITKGVTIGDNVVIVPGSVVVSSIKSGCIVSGNPARPIKPS